MASVQARRDKVTNESVILVEKDRVPKIATHFESLAGKARDGESELERKRREEGRTEKRVDGEKAGFVGKVKGEAVVVGWEATQYTLEKVGEATKVVANITSSVAGYTGEKVVVAKDMVADAGKTVVRYAGEKIAATTDAVVAAEEKAAEYAARKQAEAQTQLEANQAIRASHSHSHEIVKEEEESKEQREAAPEKFMGMFLEDEQGGILEAIGETILEIGQTTKAFLLGFNPIQHKDEAGFREEH